MIRHLFALSISAFVALAAGCTSIPRSGMPISQFPSLGCPEINDQLGQAQETQAKSNRAKQASWKAIVPPIVLARYLHARSREKEARRREGKLLREQQSRNCILAVG